MNHIGLPIKYDKNDPKFSNDLSFMSEEDWKQYDQRRKEKETKALQDAIKKHNNS